MMDNFIGEFEKNVPEDFCNELITWYEWASENNWTVSSNVEHKEWDIDPATRTDQFITIPERNPSERIEYYPSGLMHQYFEYVKPKMIEYLEFYDVYFDGLLSYYEMKFHKVKETEGFHSWHYETPHHSTRDRVLVIMTYLKAPEEGGETEFRFQSKRITPTVGKTLIWPTGFTHMHRGNPPLKGEKLYVTGWMNIQPQPIGATA